jgi:hypothetical protein
MAALARPPLDSFPLTSVAFGSFLKRPAPSEKKGDQRESGKGCDTRDT